MPRLHLFNSLTGSIDEFLPLSAVPRMYVCGPTVYARAHLGNARSSVIFDVLDRILRLLYGDCEYARNVTDIDDKIIEAAQKSNRQIAEVADEYTAYFQEDMRFLNCLDPTFEPRATRHLLEMTDMIERLVRLDKAYITESGIYLRVRACKDYGKLSRRSIDEQLSERDEDLNMTKDDLLDFALWKFEDDVGVSSTFESPCRHPKRGRPGWHIECTAMAIKYLGRTFDIHGGGVDLKFPHHENEIAQATSCYEDSGYARFWVHNGFLTINSKKMSKSLGNFLTVEDMRAKGYDGNSIRLMLLNAHYRKPLNFEESQILVFQKALNEFWEATECLEVPEVVSLCDLDGEFLMGLLNDINTPVALARLHKLKAAANKSEVARKNLAAALSFLGFTKTQGGEAKLPTEVVDKIQDLLMKRQAARANKDFALSDRIREELLEMGIILKDEKEGTTSWQIAPKSFTQ